MTAQNGEELELSVADITHNHDRLYIELDYSAQSVMTKSERIKCNTACSIYMHGD